MAEKHPTTPCAECPFRKTTPPGQLGGSPAEVYLGQLRGPFVIPCHMHIDYTNKSWKDEAFEYPQCAGAASLRGTMGLDPLMPATISKAPACDDVFATASAFIQHHTGCTKEQADELTTTDALLRHLMVELQRAGVKIRPVGDQTC